MPEKCRYFKECDAPLCPIDQESLDNGIFYADEEICRARKFATLPWIVAQKKIAKKCSFEDGYFNFQMLNRNCVIGRGIKGLDPDHAEKPQLERWLKKHPPKRELSEQEKEKLRKRFQDIRDPQKIIPVAGAE